MQLKKCAVYGDGVVTGGTCQSGLRSFVPEISRWMVLHGCVDQLELIVIK